MIHYELVKTVYARYCDARNIWHLIDKNLYEFRRFYEAATIQEQIMIEDWITNLEHDKLVKWLKSRPNRSYHQMSIDELRVLAAARGVSYYSRRPKQSLIEALEKLDVKQKEQVPRQEGNGKAVAGMHV